MVGNQVGAVNRRYVVDSNRRGVAGLADAVDPWGLRYDGASDGEALLFYVAFGAITPNGPLKREAYRCAGIPDGFELMAYDRIHHAEYIAGFLEGEPWDRFCSENPSVAISVCEAPGCMVLRGSQANAPTLAYLRDAVGLLTFLLDHGACAIYDPQTLSWWSAEQWRERIFAPATPVPNQHVVILLSEEEGSDRLTWVHTRGMRKFGRPDLSIRRVGPAYLAAVIELCDRFIEYQVFGGSIPEGAAVRLPSLPAGGVAHHGGGHEDPDFNNVHVEFTWPEPALS